MNGTLNISFASESQTGDGFYGLHSAKLLPAQFSQVMGHKLTFPAVRRLQENPVNSNYVDSSAPALAKSLS